LQAAALFFARKHDIMNKKALPVWGGGDECSMKGADQDETLEKSACLPAGWGAGAWCAYGLQRAGEREHRHGR